MTAREVTGHVRVLRADNEWFGAEDFVDGGDVPLQITGVFHDDDLKIGGKKKAAFFLTLANLHGPCKKRMMLNATRRKALSAMYGGQVEKWKGQWVWVYADKVRDPSGESESIMGMKFRIRKDAPKQVSAKQSNPADRDPLSDYRDQLAKCTTEAECRDLYERCGNPEVSGWSSEQDRQARVEMDERIAAVKGGAK